MKRVFSVLIGLCVLASMLSVVTLAAPADVFCISGQQKDGTLVKLKTYSVYDDGWNYAMERAIDHDWLNDKGYVRIVVDLLADWKAVDGEFTDSFFNGKGFNWDAIYVYDDARITLNLNGHTIDRGLEEYEYNGEVIFVDEDADFIINGGKDANDSQTGTIRGGFSCNGAGGIHIDDAKVTLNNVNVVGNAVEDEKGSAIVLRDGAKLSMNGGSISHNRLTVFFDTFDSSNGTVYVDGSDAVFNKVTFSENLCFDANRYGLVIYSDGECDITLNECVVENNGLCKAEGEYRPYNLFYSMGDETALTLNKCTVKNNATVSDIILIGEKLTVSECTFSGNSINGAIIRIYNHNKLRCTVTSTDFKDNSASVFFANSDYIMSGSELTFTGCNFSNNETENAFTFRGDERVVLKLVDCELGNSVLEGTEHIEIINTKENKGVGSIIGEGSMNMVVSFLALFISIAAIGVIIVSNKNNAAR